MCIIHKPLLECMHVENKKRIILSQTFLGMSCNEHTSRYQHTSKLRFIKLTMQAKNSAVRVIVLDSYFLKAL